MPNYRRLYISGACYFFTLVTHQRTPILNKHALPHLKASLLSASMRMPFRIPAIVVLPDHLHCLWSLPSGDVDYSRRWQFIKASFTRRIKRADENISLPIWQKRYWEHLIRDEEDFQRHLDYIHFNPVKHGYAIRPIDYPWSSFRSHVGRGYYPVDWGSAEPANVNGLDFE